MEKPLIGFENYIVNHEGSIRTLDRYVNFFRGKRLVKGIVLKQHTSNSGYKYIFIKTKETPVLRRSIVRTALKRNGINARRLFRG